jgi:hypothetical protein
VALVRHHPGTDSEVSALPAPERVAMDHAVDKLVAMGERLPFPHQSGIRGSAGLRELRPRSGRSPWRGFYAKVGVDLFVLLAIGPEAQLDPKGFQRAVDTADARRKELEFEVKP